jgi:general nucleoside transport system permease protein
VSIIAASTRRGAVLRRVGDVALRPALAVLAVGLLVAATGYAPGPALAALWRGSLGSPYVIVSVTLLRATPLILTGLAVAIAFRASVWNIGAEGQFLAGATAVAALGSLSLPRIVALPLALALGAIAGGVWAGIAALLRRRFGVLEVISTIMLNFLAVEGVGWLVRGPLQEPLHIYPQTPMLPHAFDLPRLAGSRLHAGFLLALIAALVAGWVVKATAPGFRLRATGANPFAAASAGLINVPATATRAFLVSGALAGLAGAIEVTGVTHALYEDISPGYGYTAIAVALLAGLEPYAVIATGILFGALEAGAAAMQRDAGVPSVVVSVVEATLILIFLIPKARNTSERSERAA